MRRKKRTVTTVEAHQFFVIRRPENAAPALCSQCPAGQGVMVAPDEAAALAGVSPRAVYRLVESGAIHFAETPDGVLLVCLDSFARADSSARAEHDPPRKIG